MHNTYNTIYMNRSVIYKKFTADFRPNTKIATTEENQYYSSP